MSKKCYAGGLSAARHAEFELRIFQNVKIKELIVFRKVSFEIAIYCNDKRHTIY